MSRKHSKSLTAAAAGIQAALQSGDLWTALRPHMAKAKWAEVVGPQVAAVTQVEKVQGTELVVRVKNSVWANELSFLKADIVRRLNLALGGPVLTGIRFKASGLAREKSSTPASVQPSLPDADALARIRVSEAAAGHVEQLTAPITDEALRARVRASLLRAARLQAWKQAHGWQPCARCGTLFVPAAPASVCALCRVVPLSSTAPRA